MDNRENNWKSFLISFIAYFIIIIIYALIGVDVIILSKKLEQLKDSYNHIDYLYPTDGEKPPYNCTKNISKDKSCKKDGSTPWPYNYLTKNAEQSNDFAYWYKYKFASIVYEAYTWNRGAMKYGLDMLSNVPDIILLVIGPIIINLLIIVATIWGSIGSIWGLIEFSSIGNPPSLWINFVILPIFIVCIGLTVLFNNLIDGTRWYGILLNIIISMVTFGFGGLFLIVICFMPIFLMFSSLFSLFYPLYFDKRKSVLEIFADNKYFLSLLYAAIACVFATIYLNITLASTMWVGFAILLLMNIISFF